MCNIDEIMQMLDWNQPQEIQKRGIELAKNVMCFHVFIRPMYRKYNKNVWENCARIITQKTDDELELYLPELFQWLEDLNWPGAICIWDRLKEYRNKEKLNSMLFFSIDKAKRLKNKFWLGNLYEFYGNRDFFLEPEKEEIKNIFVERVYEHIIREGMNVYKVVYGDIKPYNEMPEAWKKQVELYQSINAAQKEVFLDAIKKAKIDAIYSLLIMLEGGGNVEDKRRFNIQFKINDKNVAEDISDIFFRVAEECSAR